MNVSSLSSVRFRIAAGERLALLSRLRAELDRQEQARRIELWALGSARLATPDLPFFESYVWVVPAPSPGGLGEAELAAAVTSCLEGLDGALTEDWKGLSLENLERRFGAGDGVRIHLDYEALDTRRVIDLFELQRADAGLSASDVALAGILHHAACFESRGAGLAGDLRHFILFVQRSRKDPQGYFQDKEARAKELLSGLPAIRDRLDGLLAGDWGALGAVFAKYEARARAIGRRLREFSPRLPQGMPLPLAVWNNFAHLHLLRLGISNDAEAVLCLLIALRLEEQAR
ncbi:MAG TPA: hypothetical protein VM598_04660 [Bdellovibrionota bacterium]|nr:hypothetical protein [Bdellovibrionota bacterium]